jgi:tRNA pseudouridine55 synthase
VLLVDKPAGMTSHDVVNRVRRALGERRVGHAGTLDPMATGLLLVLVGPYTRLEPYLSSQTKRYTATLSFGAETDTDDAEGRVTHTLDVPGDALDAAYARSLLASLLGDSLQTPPVYSAIKVGGRVAHRAARAGDPLEVSPRPISVTRAELLDVTPGPPTSWTVDFTVSKGTYIRALARDIGRAAGSAAHLSGLVRTEVGAALLQDALTLDDIVETGTGFRPAEVFTDPVPLLNLPVLEADADHVRFGRSLPIPDIDGDLVAVLSGGVLVAIYRRTATALVPEAVFPVVVKAAS